MNPSIVSITRSHINGNKCEEIKSFGELLPIRNNECIAKNNPNTELKSNHSDHQNFLEKLIGLCEIHHDHKMEEMFRNFIHVFSFEKGRLEISLSGNSPEGLIKNIAMKLKQWTGENWEIRFPQGLCFKKFNEDDDIQSVRKVFPDSQVVCVRTIPIKG
ncbi:MAG: hypothetical protein EU981_01135 [Candidatus Liberibacter ctenarytainae]|uniref:DNA polymerase III subunit gamma/ tau C-terminal domain-containing protein n=1 Tax=Candidatus Liberibacter ctenarytainae TaxID=2020335 RepID=A0A937DIT7_9HYPH|nr:hypothetical protein [Candidatus Liberibacter ctenarytainae]